MELGVHIKRKTGKTPIWVSYRSYYGGQR